MSVVGKWRKRRAIDAPALVGAVPFWWHSIDFGDGLVSPGVNSLDFLRWDFDELRLPDLHGRSVLDIGAWDGFYSFEAVRRGAGRVVALDHYVWSLDLDAQQRYWRECRERGEVPRPYHEVASLWHPDALPGKRGFDAANAILGGIVQPVVADFMECDIDSLGTFDVVLFLGVLYHLEDPLRALRRLRAVTRELAVISTQAVRVRDHEDRAMWEFFEGGELNDDVSNWWAPNLRGLCGACRAAGFTSAERVAGEPQGDDESPITRYRTVLHARTN
jgi:tRNA (mo5U34)-methyltransferase